MEGEKDGKLEVGGGGVSCRSSVTRSLFDCWSEFETTLQWTNRKLTIRSIFASLSAKVPSTEYPLKIKQK